VIGGFFGAIPAIGADLAAPVERVGQGAATPREDCDVTRLKRGIARMLLMALAAGPVLMAGTAWAVTFNAALDSSYPVQVIQGQTVTDAFAVKLTASGAFNNHTGNLIVCNAVTLNADGTGTCTSQATIPLQESTGRPPQIPGFPQDVQVTVTAAPDVPCDATYTLTLDVELDVTGGADFGQTADGEGIRKVSLPFDVQVGCAALVLEGCSQGFWKNHTGAWQALDPADTVSSVFANAAAYGLGGATLHQALGFPGGSSLTEAAQILLRQAVAAMLNAYHDSVEYPRTDAEIMWDVDTALASASRSTILSLAADLDGDNNLGCPLE
jgi:hypothetical protein